MDLPRHTLEEHRRLSQSLLWKLQEEAYCRFGIEAWNEHGVPSYITSNSYIAKIYAQVVLGFLRDGVANSSITVEHPIYLLDLGAGTGRFAYFFLKELLRFLDCSSLPKLKICYVMTDIASDNIDFWQKHPYLKSYFEQGILDCAYYHHAQNEPIDLMKRKETLTKETLINPLILICNYFFDTIPQDLFRFKEGCLEEGRITLWVEGTEAPFFGPAVINHLQYCYAYEQGFDPEIYYEVPELNVLLKSYAYIMEGHSFLFPIGAFQVLHKFIDLSRSRLLLLAGDQGACTTEQMQQAGEPKLALHGSFSMPVSYHAIASFFRRREEGSALLTSFSDSSFAVMAGMLGKKNECFLETSLAFHQEIDNFEPSDYLKLVSMTQERWKECPVDYLLLLIKLGNWDASVLLTFFSSFRQAIPFINEQQKQFLAKTIDRVWDHFYPIGPSTGDFVLNLGVLLFEMKCYQQALIYFERSMQISGSNPTALKNIAACHQMLRSFF